MSGRRVLAYSYDHLNRLTQMQRGSLSGGVITGTPVREMDYWNRESNRGPGRAKVRRAARAE